VKRFSGGTWGDPLMNFGLIVLSHFVIVTHCRESAAMRLIHCAGGGDGRAAFG
jgi:hypothetical protein